MIGCFCKACKSGRLQSTPAAFILACEKSKDCKNPCLFAALNDNNYRKYLQTWIIRNPRQTKLSSMCWCVLRKIAFCSIYGPHFDHDLLLLRLLQIRLFEAPGAFILDCSWKLQRIEKNQKNVKIIHDCCDRRCTKGSTQGGSLIRCAHSQLNEISLTKGE